MSASLDTPDDSPELERLARLPKLIRRAETPDEDIHVSLSDFIAEQRDQYPRLANDMDSEELADAILANYLVLPRPAPVQED